MVRPGYKRTEVGVIPEEWEVAHLESVVPSGKKNGIVDGPFGSNLKSIHYRTEGIPIITSGYVTRGRFEANEYLYVDKEKFLREKRSAVEGGDIVMAKIGARCGSSAILPLGHETGILSGNALKISVDATRHSAYFIWQVLWNLYQSGAISDIVSTGAQPAISMASLKKLQVALPAKREQDAIAAALSDVDDLIASLDKLIAKKQAVKTAVMQDLLTGRRRLPGFEGEWERKMLGDLGYCIRGVSYSGSTDLYPHDTNNSVRLLRSNNIRDSAINREDLQHVDSSRVSAEQVMLPGDILICTANGSKELVGKAAAFNVSDGYEYTFGAFMGCFRITSDSANPRFTSYLFQSMEYRKVLGTILAGSSINNLKPSDVEAITFNIPSRYEQDAIAEVLSDIDAEIAALQTRREKTKAIKQGMMQELLTGRVRLV